MVKDDRYTISQQLGSVSGLLDAAFHGRLLTDGFMFLKKDDWPTTIKTLKQEFSGEPLGYLDLGWSQEIMFEDSNKVLVHATLSNGNIQIEAAGDNEAVVDAAIEAIKEEAPRTDTSNPNQALITFWALGGHGPFSVNKLIDVPTWEDIEGNYSAPVAEELTRMVTSFKPAHGGQLLLWHGEPGTGKTYALRALAREWKDWCDVHYIVDPEKFFGMDASYLVQVIMGGQYDDDEEEGEDAEPKRWRLMVFEDTGELLSEDAAARSGQGLSRFLNVVDGLIGQGMRIILLVTTNEDLNKLHPAVARPGRCASNVKFTPLDPVRATAFLQKAGDVALHGKVARTTTLAELYALVEEFHEKIGDSPRPIGFLPKEVDRSA